MDVSITIHRLTVSGRTHDALQAARDLYPELDADAVLRLALQEFCERHAGRESPPPDVLPFRPQ